jgi:hypothetical protein
MPSRKCKRAKGVQMTEQQSKIPQIIDIVQMPPTADIIQMAATQDIVQRPSTEDILQMAAEISQIQYGSQTPDTAQIEDIVAMASDIQPLRVHLGRLLYLEFKEWNGRKRVELRFWKDDTVPTKEGVSLHLDQWKALCNMSDVIDDLLTSHRKRTSRVAIPYRRQRFRYHQRTLRLCSYQKTLYAQRRMDLPSYQERCGFTL